MELAGDGFALGHMAGVENLPGEDACVAASGLVDRSGRRGGASNVRETGGAVSGDAACGGDFAIRAGYELRDSGAASNH